MYKLSETTTTSAQMSLNNLKRAILNLENQIKNKQIDNMLYYVNAYYDYLSKALKQNKGLFFTNDVDINSYFINLNADIAELIDPINEFDFSDAFIDSSLLEHCEGINHLSKYVGNELSKWEKLEVGFAITGIVICFAGIIGALALSITCPHISLGLLLICGICSLASGAMGSLSLHGFVEGKKESVKKEMEAPKRMFLFFKGNGNDLDSESFEEDIDYNEVEMNRLEIN